MNMLSEQRRLVQSETRSEQRSLEEETRQVVKRRVGLILGGIARKLIDARTCVVELEGPEGLVFLIVILLMNCADIRPRMAAGNV